MKSCTICKLVGSVKVGVCIAALGNLSFNLHCTNHQLAKHCTSWLFTCKCDTVVISFVVIPLINTLHRNPCTNLSNQDHLILSLPRNVHNVLTSLGESVSDLPSNLSALDWANQLQLDNTQLVSRSLGNESAASFWVSTCKLDRAKRALLPAYHVSQ